jgi:hypothetical protein
MDFNELAETIRGKGKWMNAGHERDVEAITSVEDTDMFMLYEALGRELISSAKKLYSELEIYELQDGRVISLDSPSTDYDGRGGSLESVIEHSDKKIKELNDKRKEDGEVPLDVIHLVPTTNGSHWTLSIIQAGKETVKLDSFKTGQQTDGHSCGVHVMENMKLFINDKTKFNELLNVQKGNGKKEEATNSLVEKGEGTYDVPCKSDHSIHTEDEDKKIMKDFNINEDLFKDIKGNLAGQKFEIKNVLREMGFTERQELRSSQRRSEGQMTR